MKMATPVTRNAQNVPDRPALDAAARVFAVAVVISPTLPVIVSGH